MRRVPLAIRLFFPIVSRLERVPTTALERMTAAMVSVTVLLTAFGSSSVQMLLDLGRPGRWLSLLLLGILAALMAIRVGGRPVGPLRVLMYLLAALGALALLSTAYSTFPRLTFERGITFVFMLGVAIALGHAASRLTSLPRRLAEGIVVGAGLVAVAGLVVYVLDRGAAVQPSGPLVPARWQGVGQNPNTVSMLCGVAIGPAVWLLATAGGRRRLVWWAGAVALALSILASGSRGGLAGGVVGALTASVLLPRPARLRVAAVTAVFVVGLGGPAIVDHVVTPGRLNPSEPVRATPGRAEPGPRRFISTGSSGRVGAWKRGLAIGAERPALGFGFGTEEKVFVPRFQDFNGLRPENSFVGLFMQLGVVGLALFTGVVLLVAAAALAALRRRDQAAAPFIALCASAAVLLLVESYVYSVGNVASMSVWIAAAVLVAVTGRGAA
jgi:hypothetical protein